MVKFAVYGGDVVVVSTFNNFDTNSYVLYTMHVQYKFV